MGKTFHKYVSYYNDFDKNNCEWLQNLIDAKLIPYGFVDDRSIIDVKASELEGFTQAHFFTGIAGWPLALQLAGVPSSTKLWTGSAPCQPFSAAGKQLGQFDSRHLAPVFLNLIGQCKPPIIFGEQVEKSIAKGWADDLQTHLEGQGYSTGFAVLPACFVGAPHKRERLFFGANRMVNPNSNSDRGTLGGSYAIPQGATFEEWQDFSKPRESCGAGSDVHFQGCSEDNLPLANSDCERLERVWSNSNSEGWEGQDLGQVRLRRGTGCFNPWAGCRWIEGNDGKYRPIEPNVLPMVNGFPKVVDKELSELYKMARSHKQIALKGFGNAIVPQVAAEFVKAFMKSL